MFRRCSNGLVDGSCDFFAAQRGDNAFDLPPIAEARDIAVVPAALGPLRRFKAGIVAEALDKVRGVGKRVPAVDKGTVHGIALTMGPVSRPPTNVVNAALTISVGFAAPGLQWRTQ